MITLGEAVARELPVMGTLGDLIEEFGLGQQVTPTKFDRRSNMAEDMRMFEDEQADFVATVAPLLAPWRAALRRQVTQRKLHGRSADPERILSLRIPRGVFNRVRAAIGMRLRTTWRRAALGAEKEVEKLQARAKKAEPPPDAFIKQQALDFFKAKSFWVTGLIEDDLLKSARAVLFAGIKEDRALGATLFELDQAIGDFLPTVDKAGRVVNIPHRLETIARTNVVEAVNEGRQTVFNDPDLEGFVLGFVYSAILDSRVRPNHAALHGLAFKKGDPLVAKVTPPLGFNCRCLLRVATITDDDIEWTTQLPVGAGPDPGFK